MFFGILGKPPKRFGVFDIPKSLGLVWWSHYSPQVKNSQVLKSLLTPQVAISPMVCNWSQDSTCGIKVAMQAGRGVSSLGGPTTNVTYDSKVSYPRSYEETLD
jgi:hypothetical protein